MLFGSVFGVTDVNVVFQLLLGVVGVVLGELSCARTAAASFSRSEHIARPTCSQFPGLMLTRVKIWSWRETFACGTLVPVFRGYQPKFVH